jgi:3-dehydrotetronate 4-kinase
MKHLLFGAIADDYTGATDLAGMLSEQGIRTIQVIGNQPDNFLKSLKGKYQAIVIALKSRSIDKNLAREMSLSALKQLKSLEARQIQFKYCSTFDSTTEGNIGPVTESLMDELKVSFTIAVPSLPVNGRTQYMGYLFVGDKLISETHMRNHPVTPMTEPNLVKHLQPQTGKRVGLIPYSVVSKGAEKIKDESRKISSEGTQIALVDVIRESDLEAIAEAFVDDPLITGGSGLAMKLPQVWKSRGLVEGAQESKAALAGGKTMILAGSCSEMTLKQIGHFRESKGEGLRIDTSRLATEELSSELNGLFTKVEKQLESEGWALVYSSAEANDRQTGLDAAGRKGLKADELREKIEKTTGLLARMAVERAGVKNIVVAGGETSGAVIDTLRLQALEIGSNIDPGVPLTRSIGELELNLVCKSGNFGSVDFFVKTLNMFRTGTRS